MQHLAIVLWEPSGNIDNDDIETDEEIDVYQEETTMHITDGEPDPELIKFEKGISMPSFFKNQRIALQAVKDLCPDCIIIADNNPLDWDSPFSKCKASRQLEYLIKLACLINMPITLYEGVKNSKQPLKHIYCTGD